MASDAPHTEGDGPCIGCGETNHTAHNVSICAVCRTRTMHGYQRVICRHTNCRRLPEFCTEHVNGEDCVTIGCSQIARICLKHHDEQVKEVLDVLRADRCKGDVPHLVNVSFTPFEAAMVLCVLAVAKGGESQYDTADMPIRRRALENAYKRLSLEMSVPVMADA